MNLYQQFELLGRKQLAIEEGITLLRQARADLQLSKASADRWGAIAISANVLLVPLNCIISAFELKGCKNLYEMLVRELYKRYSQSGTRLSGTAKPLLAALKQGIIQELKRKALTEYVPGVNILVGLAEDSIAVWQTQQMVTQGESEMARLTLDLDRKISAALWQLQDIGRRSAAIIDRMEQLSRTA
jgi:hypothetical protein